MKKNNDRLKHAVHNEAVCNFLDTNVLFADWTITTAFYSALHFINYKIFPQTVSSIEGKKTIIENIDQYSSYNNPKRVSKHELLSDLAAKHCTAISEDYDWLLDMSMNARYKHYQHDKEIANKARRLLLVIKTHCATIQEIKAL